MRNEQKEQESLSSLLDLKVLHQIPEGILILNKDFEVVFWNNLIADWTGIAENKIIGKVIFEFFPRLKEPRYFRRLQEVFKGGPPAIFSSQLHKHFIPCLTADGSRRIQHTVVNLYKLENRESPLAVVTIQDVTEQTLHILEYRTLNNEKLKEIESRKELEVNLKNEAEYFKFLHSIAIISNENENYIEAIKLCLKNICDLSGFSLGHLYLVTKPEGDVLSTDVWQVRGEVNFKQFVEAKERTKFSKGEGLPGRVIEEARAVWIEDVSKERGLLGLEEAKGMPIKGAFAFPVFVKKEAVAVLEFFSETQQAPDENILRLLAVAGFDIGRIIERFQSYESLLKAKKEAEKANSAKSEFLSTMSHELRTPLNAILGFSQLLKMDGEGVPGQRAKKNVDRILSSGSHLLELINEILDLSRIEAGKIDLMIENINLSKLMGELMAIADSIGKKYKVTIEDKISSGETFFVLGDRLRVKQVLMNLISNAIKYNHAHGTVVLYTQEVGDSLRIHVKDTGRGIPEEKHEKIFEPFNRLGMDKETIEGTGVGLAISKKLTEIMDGTIGFESLPGAGSDFYIELPLAGMTSKNEISNGANPQMASAGKTEPEKKVVLCIEDDMDNLELVKQALAINQDIEFLSAPEARMGIETTLNQKPDLILLDINLPDLNGYEALKILRERVKTKNTLIVAFSANSTGKDMKRALDAGFDDYIVKPINIHEFLKKVNKLLN